jgi:hypothetical protein
MRRREFITLLGGAAATWPLAVRGQQLPKIAHLGMLLPSGVGEREQIAAGLQQLGKLGWNDGDNLKITYKWIPSMEFEVLRANAADLVRMGPDVIWVLSNPALAALQRTTRTIPTGLRAGCRSRRRRLCRKPSETRRQHHRVHEFRGLDG